MGKRWIVFFILIIAMVIYGCGTPEQKKEMDSLPRVEYKLSPSKMIIDETLIEGANEIVFAVTPEERAKYVPKTIWRQAEKNVDEEENTFTFVAASERLNEKDIVRFLSGDSKILRMGKNDWFLLALNVPYWLSELGICAKGNLTAMVTDRSMVKHYEEMEFSVPQVKAFDAPLLCKYLLVKASDETGVELRYLHTKGKTVFASQIARTMGENPVVLDEKDPKNPLNVWRFPLRRNYYNLAEKLLEGSGTLSNHQKMMVFMDYIADFYVGLSTNEVGIEEYIGACGEYSDLLSALAWTQKMPARIVTMGNYPTYKGHTVCEVFYDNAWHLYDPTYGAYYTVSSAEEAEHPYVLGFEELTQGGGNTPDAVCVVTVPQRLERRDSYGFLGPHIYEAANPKGVIGPNHPLIYPLVLEISSDERSSLTAQDFSTKYQGIEYIGAAGINNMHEWTLKGLKEGERYDFVVTAESYNGDRPGKFIAKAMSKNASILFGTEHHFDNGEPASMQWRITFIPSSDTADVLLTHDYRGPDFCFVRFSGFELRRVD